jgi:hypothetical protein
MDPGIVLISYLGLNYVDYTYITPGFMLLMLALSPLDIA